MVGIEMELGKFKVSVIVPTYKRSSFVCRAVDSILQQTYKNIEVIVVDDNVPNSDYRFETEKKMQKYSGLGNVIYKKNNTNFGGALARNEGIKCATGDYVTFLDDDDIYLPDKILAQLEYMVENDLDLSFTDVRIHDMTNRLVDYREHSYIKSFANQELLKYHLMHHLTPTATYMFRKSSLEAIGGFDDIEVGQEYMLMLKAIEGGLKIGYLPVAHVIQYLHDGERISIGKKKLEKEIELYHFKKQYFSRLTVRERQYVRFRHHAVMAIVGKRSGFQTVFAKHALFAIAISPVGCIGELLAFFNKRRKHSSRGSTEH